MDKKLRKDILSVLRENDCALELNKLKKMLIDKFGHPERVEGQVDIFSSKVSSYLSTLEQAGFVILKTGSIGGHGVRFYSLTEKGYKEFDPWYKKLWSFINDDFAKLLSLISLILSIVATVISISK